MKWRQMQPHDLDLVVHIAARVHPHFPEARAVFANKLSLHPSGALVLESSWGLAGYCFAHPWHCTEPPQLDTMLGAIPPGADALYVHDIALLPEAHGAGAGTAAITVLLAQAALLGFERISLVAVNGSIPYWLRHGFVVMDSPVLRMKLASYGGDARLMVHGAL